jgi:hypothetical protein
MKLISLALILVSLNAFSVECPKDRKDYFCIPPETIFNSEMNVANFYIIPAKVLGLFRNELTAINYPLELKADWNSPYFGAGVSLYENSFKLMILGGTARMKEMTLDAYAANVCHEVGHVIGGDPKQTITGADWASSEGQADFFAATICLKRFYQSEGISNEVDLKNKIEKAGFDFMNLASKIESDPKNKFFQRAKVKMAEVDHTLINRYPSLQCRYETFRNQLNRPTCWYKD